jgi:hypothetical protein
MSKNKIIIVIIVVFLFSLAIDIKLETNEFEVLQYDFLRIPVIFIISLFLSFLLININTN